jgi:hypothetical protein
MLNWTFIITTRTEFRVLKQYGEKYLQYTALPDIFRLYEYVKHEFTLQGIFLLYTEYKF